MVAVFLVLMVAPTARSASAASPTRPDISRCTALNSKLSRFKNTRYAEIFAGPGLRSVSPEALYSKAKSAADAGEIYLALFFSTLLTDAAAENPAVWKNRAVLAGSLGLVQEAHACEQRSSAPGTREPLAPYLLPGSITNEPKSLADWAAAVALLGWSTEARQPGVFTYFDDSLSGFDVDKHTNKYDGTTMTSVWTHVPKIADLLPNLYIGTRLHPMRENTVSTGKAIGMGLLAGLVGSAGAYSGNTVQANALVEEISASLGRGLEQPSRYKGGDYVMRRFENGHFKDQAAKPLPAAEYDAIHVPTPFLWALGSPFLPSVEARIVDAKDHDVKLRLNKTDGYEEKAETRRLPDLQVVKLARLSSLDDTEVTLLEVLLKPEDLDLLFGVEAQPVKAMMPDLTKSYDAYRDYRGSLSLPPTSLRIFGGDGRCYSISPTKETEWLVSVRPKK
jgi:hypothetical protein